MKIGPFSSSASNPDTKGEIFGRTCGATSTLAALLALCVATFSSIAWATDFFSHRIQRPAPPQAEGRAAPQHAYVFGVPAYWPTPLRWRYNHAGAPAQFNANKAATIEQIVAATTRWTAACGVQLIYEGETTTAPETLASGLPDRANVIGWKAPQGGYMAATHAWTDSNASGDPIIVDADISLSPATVTTPQLLASIVLHELGHAIGVGHSPVAGALMSGPPDAAYSNAGDLTPDDVQGCRCLYGPPAGAQAGFVCSLPSKIDFGAAPVGTQASATRREVSVTNDGTAALTVSGIRVSASDFIVGNNRCAQGSTLAPGATCAFDLSAAPASVGVRTAEAVIETSVGPYRIALRTEGTSSGTPPPLPPSTLNFEGPWWNAPAGSESGWGVNLAHQDDVIFATWFTYDSTGKARWLSATALRTSTHTYAGTLYRTSGPALDSAPFDGNQVQRSAAGSMTLAFDDSENGTFTYEVDGVVQTKQITRLVFGPLPTCTFGPSNPALATNFQGNWWSANATESGWGVYFTHQGDNIFVSWFTYDGDGAPIWLSATAAKNGHGVYSGALVRTAGPAYNAVPFDSQSVARTTVGSATLTFNDGNNATFAYTVTFGNPQTTVTQSKQLTRLVFRAPGTVCR